MKASTNSNSYLKRASVLIAITFIWLYTATRNPAPGHLRVVHIVLLVAAGLCLWRAFALLLSHKE